MRRSDLDRLNLLFAEFAAASSGLRRTSFMTNFHSERERFLNERRSGRSAEAPNFDYSAVTQLGDVSRLRILADKLKKEPDSAARERLNRLVQGALHADPLIVEELPQRYDAVLREADRLLQLSGEAPCRDAAEVLTAATGQAVFQGALLRLGLDDWSVELNPGQSSRFSINPGLRRIRIRAEDSFTSDELRRLAVHEIGVHVQRAESGGRQSLHMLRVGVPGYLEFEEGLAVYLEDRYGFLAPWLVRRYAGRALAVGLSLKVGFADAFDALVERGVEESDAFEMVARSKLGLSSVHLLGANPKGLSYLAGYLSIKQTIREGGHLGDWVGVGKVTPDDVTLLNDLDELQLLSPPAFRPEDALDSVDATLKLRQIE